jgi:hypothetical protein
MMVGAEGVLIVLEQLTREPGGGAWVHDSDSEADCGNGEKVPLESETNVPSNVSEKLPARVFVVASRLSVSSKSKWKVKGPTVTSKLTGVGTSRGGTGIGCGPNVTAAPETTPGASPKLPLMAVSCSGVSDLLDVAAVMSPVFTVTVPVALNARDPAAGGSTGIADTGFATSVATKAAATPLPTRTNPNVSISVSSSNGARAKSPADYFCPHASCHSNLSIA